jgi:hypothetical protein
VVLSGSNPAKRTDIYPRIRAEFLVYHGFAVLLYDKRGVGDSGGVYQAYATDSNINNLAGDGLAAVQFLKARPEVNPRQIGVYGSSQAGWIAPRIATRSSDVAFMLLLSGPTVSPSQQQYYRSLLSQRSLTEAEVTRLVLEQGPQDFDPRPYLVKTTIPALWIFGGQDENIPGGACAAILQQLQQSGQRNPHVSSLTDGQSRPLRCKHRSYWRKPTTPRSGAWPRRYDPRLAPTAGEYSQLGMRLMC